MIERGTKEIHRDLFFDSFSVGLGAASLATRNRDRERVRQIPGSARSIATSSSTRARCCKRFAESYVVDTKFDLDAVVDGVVNNYPGCST